MASADNGTASDAAATAAAEQPAPVNAAPTTPAATPAAPLTLVGRPVLGRDDILNAPDLRFELVAVDEWKNGAVVKVSQLTSEARAQLEDFIASRKVASGGAEITSNVSIREMFVALCVVGDDGQRLFSIDDVAVLGKKNARPIERIFDAAKNLNDVSNDAVAREAGNSASGASDTSP